MKHWNACSNAEKVERWENVLRVLRGLSRHERKKHFSMANWGIETACGTVACAAGFCGLDRWFIRRGFKLIPADYFSDDPMDLDFINDNYAGLGRIAGSGINIDTTQVVASFFGQKGSEEIFYSGDTRPVGKVINEVRRHITWLKNGG